MGREQNGASMETPGIAGLHHIQFPVSDLDASIAWFERVLGACYQPEFDHHDARNARYAVILDVPGLPFPVQLRLSRDMAEAMAGYEPVTFGAADRAHLDEWAAHLDACGVRHSSVRRARIGETIDFASPDGARLRFYTLPVGGYENPEFRQ
jgi:catechol 2,3-dioxygenase-like lactoylglutathione lyase family enzyme